MLNNIQEHTMTLIHVLSHTGSPQVHCSWDIGIIYKYFKRYDVPHVDSGIDSCANHFGASYEVGVLQYKRLKTIACSALHFRPCMPSIFVASVETNLFLTYPDGTS